LGNGTGVLGDAPVPVSMPLGVTFTAIAAGNGDDLAIDSTGHAWAWGSNLYGQLGNGTTTDSSVPVAVAMPKGVTFTAISAGDQGLTSDSLALDSTGHAWAWGFNGNGELGDGTTTGPDTCYSGHPCSLTPVPVSMPKGVTFTSVSAGNSVSVALDSTGHAWGWGSNGDGELGNGTTTDSSVPVAVSMPQGVTFGEISAGGEAVLALDSTGHAWAWGFNGDGELGNGNTIDSFTPVEVSMPPGVTFTSVTLGSFNSLALDSTGHAWAWGTDQDGLLGIGTTSGPQNCIFPSCSTTPVAVSIPPGVILTAISAGSVDDLVLDSTGDAWAWGDNDSGQLGDGSTTGPGMCSGLPCSSTPVAVSMPPGVVFTAVSEGNGTGLALSQFGHVTITTTTLPPGTVGQPYSFQLQATGGTPPYTWNKYPPKGQGVLPLGLHLSKSGLISGTPKRSGTYTITVKCLDSSHSHKTQAIQTLTLVINS
jgi:alpha-tubulin suppressor-like RCC1 family protein